MLMRWSLIDRELEIMYELSQAVLSHEGRLCAIAAAFAELDCFVAFAHAAKEFRLVRPEITERNAVVIKNGRCADILSDVHFYARLRDAFHRHLLQELCVASFIPNDAVIDGEAHSERRLLLLTGANYSGKSVYLKQVALIVYMAHIGCFVPAEAAVIGLVDRIITRMKTQETVSKVRRAPFHALVRFS